jgi:hypothetical protein
MPENRGRKIPFC